MNPINEHLYNALRKRFQNVKINNAGIEANYKIVTDKLAAYYNPATPRKVYVINWGETYSMNCPKCRDKRSRLYIGHLWGTFCEEANKRIYSCVKCQNESCDWSDLWDHLYGKEKASSEVKTEALKTGVDVNVRRMELPGDLQDIIPINELPETHPVVQYLLSRGFTDIDKLAVEYQFCFCAKSPLKKSFTDSSGKWHTITPENRLIIPNVQQGVWQGWMARYIGDIPRDPATGKAVIQKYLNAPGYSFSSSVYRLDEACRFSEGQFCIICEGALSAIACGPSGVCTFGMYPRPMQEELIAKAFPNGELIFMVESEAAANGRIFQAMERLKDRVAGGCTAVVLPKGKDPATMTSDEMLGLIFEAKQAKEGLNDRN